MRLRSLEGRLTILLALAALMGALVYVGVTDWPLPQLHGVVRRCASTKRHSA